MWHDLVGATAPPPTSRILVVDDDPVMRFILERQLNQLGYAVTTADCETAAEAALAEGLPALLLLDIGLGGEDGVDYLKRLKAAWPELPVVMVSGDHRIETAHHTMQMGASDYITKPVDPAHLADVLRRQRK